MKKPLAILGLALAAAGPVVAGDTPVVHLYDYTIFSVLKSDGGGKPGVVYDRGGEVFGFKTLRGGNITTAPQTLSATPVGTVNLGQGDTDALYAKLLTEARKRGLR